MAARRVGVAFLRVVAVYRRVGSARGPVAPAPRSVGASFSKVGVKGGEVETARRSAQVAASQVGAADSQVGAANRQVGAPIREVALTRPEVAAVDRPPGPTYLTSAVRTPPHELSCPPDGPLYSRPMTIDLNAFPPDVKLALISAGEEFSSDDTFAQATQTGQGLEKYADTLKAYGLPLSDTTRLAEARDLLSDSGYGRNQARSAKKTLGIGLDDANRAGRHARIRGRSILTSTKSALLEQGKKASANDVHTTLEATADSEKLGEDLAKQLDHLADALDPAKAPEAAAAAADRGGPETLAPLRAAALAIRDAVSRKPTVRGTPEETQRLDQIDGIILDICRRARDAAVAASKHLGDPAILKAFKLDKLYASRSGGAKKEAAPVAPAEGGKTP